MRFNLRVYRESVNRDTNRRRFTAGRHRRTMGVIVALIMMTALVAPNIAGAAGAVPFSGEDPATGTRTVTIADITDFHGHIEHGADVAAAFTLAVTTPTIWFPSPPAIWWADRPMSRP